MTAGGSPIEDYLDDLVEALRGSPARELRSMLAEAEAHLRDDAEAAVGRGVAPIDAETEAVARFGSAAALARAERTQRRPSPRDVAAQLLRCAVLLIGVGAAAVGVSGLLAGLIRVALGARALVDVTPGQVLSSGDCARWRALDAGARTCRDAAVADWAAETTFYRIGLGVVGVAVLLAYRRWVRPARPFLPTLLAVRDAVAMSAFSIVGAWTFGLGVYRTVNGGGAGQWFSAAPVALAAAAAFAVLLARHLGQAEGMTRQSPA